MKILSIDPGTTNGFAMVDTLRPTELLSQGQMTPLELVSWLQPILTLFDAVVCERFIIGQRTVIAAASVGDTLDVIGWLKLECGRREVPFTLQKNADALMFTDDQLRRIGWWDLGRSRGNRDVRSACRHMLKYLVDHGFLKPVDLHGNLS